MYMRRGQAGLLAKRNGRGLFIRLVYIAFSSNILESLYHLSLPMINSRPGSAPLISMKPQRCCRPLRLHLNRSCISLNAGL